VQGEDALEDEDVGRVNCCCLIEASVLFKGINWYLGDFTVLGSVKF
jgi:hypothetical protein